MVVILLFRFVNNIFKDEKDYRKNYSSNNFYSKVSFDDIWFSVLKYKTGVSILDETSNIQCDKNLFLDENGKASLVLNNSSIDKVCDVNDDFKLEYTNFENQKLYTSIVLKDVFGTSIYTPIEKYNR